MHPVLEHVPCYVQAGGTVRLYHRKRSCYVVAEGSFAGRFAKLSGHDNNHSGDTPDESGRLMVGLEKMFVCIHLKCQIGI